MKDETMSDTPEPDAPPAKKKGGKLKKIVILLVGLIVIGGGGVGGGLYAMGKGPFAHHEAVAEDPDMPHLVVREGVSEEAADRARAAARRGRVDPRVFQSTYLPLEGNFTSNLRGGDAFVQIGVGVSTFYDQRVIEHLHTHDMAIRSAILMVLSQQDPVALTTLQGKQALKQQLKDAINSALTIREGFGGIDDVYFTSFVTQ
jgi:flagellar FliL protein